MSFTLITLTQEINIEDHIDHIATEHKLKKRVIKFYWKMYISRGPYQMPEWNNSGVLEDGGLSGTFS